jgi:hypothetical protein
MAIISLEGFGKIEISSLSEFTNSNPVAEPV